MTNALPRGAPRNSEQKGEVVKAGRCKRINRGLNPPLVCASGVPKLTQAILAKAFRGELVPPEEGLARREGRKYEPATVLLERIRAERAGGASPGASARGTRGRGRRGSRKAHRVVAS